MGHYLVYAFMALAVAGVVGGIIYLAVMQKREEMRIGRIVADGFSAKCWIVMAEDILYKGFTPQEKEEASEDFHFNAQVVFTRDQKLLNLDEILEALAKELREFKLPTTPTEDEKSIAEVMATQVPHLIPIRLPERIAAGVEAYTASAPVYLRRLPGTRLDVPYICCKALLSEGLEMTRYPAG